uniref:Uncharacterized protein n=1 Tax=Pithovirus LCPAC403 TaxID=2506596 RepID=A0A481ZBE4_9VIRU|nr:MAG: hypothetical protein LCPAC403_03580 [Pithovirus LCPAC403]
MGGDKGSNYVFLTEMLKDDHKISEEELVELDNILVTMANNVNNDLMSLEEYCEILDVVLKLFYITFQRQHNPLNRHSLSKHLKEFLLKCKYGHKLSDEQLGTLNDLLDIFMKHSDGEKGAKLLLKKMLKNGCISSIKYNELIKNLS